MTKDDRELSDKEKEEARNLRRVMKSERSRGTRRPRDVKAVEYEETVRKVYAQFSDPNCSRDKFLDTIRALGQADESELVRNLLKAFDDRRR